MTTRKFKDGRGGKLEDEDEEKKECLAVNFNNSAH